MSAHVGGPRDQALAAIAEHAELRALDALLTGRFDADPGHDREHCLRVAGWALRCSAGAVPPQEVVAAALLHDIVNVPKDDPRRSSAALLSAAEARRCLPPLGFDDPSTQRVAEAIEDHSFSRGATPRSPLGRVLQDADRLEALGVLGFFRAVSTGTRMGAAYFDATDPFARQRPLDEKRYTLDHFFTKLLTLPDTFRTEVGRAEAERRATVLRHIVSQLSDEIGHPWHGSRP